jgi:hypothetical protein
MDVVTVDDHVAEVDADAKLDARLVGQAVIVIGDRALDLGGGAHGIDDAGELRQHAVAHELDDPPVVVGEHRVDQGRAQRPEGRDGAFFVGADQPRIADHVGCQDRGETAFHYPVSSPP